MLWRFETFTTRSAVERQGPEVCCVYDVIGKDLGTQLLGPLQHHWRRLLDLLEV